MRPKIGVYVIFLLIIILCSPCYAQAKTKITFLWWPDPGGGFEEIISDFKKENPDIDVGMIKGPTSTDTRETMYTALLSPAIHSGEYLLKIKGAEETMRFVFITLGI